MTFRDVAEVANGVWAIIAAWLALFIAYHLEVVRDRRGILWRRLVVCRLPLSMQMAVAVLAISAGVVCTRLVVWWARHRNPDGTDFITPDTEFYLLGTAFGIIGFLYALRTVTMPMKRAWPWIGALVNALVYVAWWASRFIG